MFSGESRLDQIQKACDIFYSSPNPSQRTQAHQFLLEYFDQNLTSEKVYEFKLILEHASSVYTAVLAANALIHVFSSKWTLIGQEFRHGLYEYLLQSIYMRAGNYMTNHNERVIVGSYINLLCKVIKTYYSELEFNTKILDHFAKFFETFGPTTLIGIKALKALVQEMQFDEKISASTKFSRHVVDFKDHCLPKIIEVAFQILGKVHHAKELTENLPAEVEQDLRRSVLELVLESLKYDFLGIKYRMDDDFHDEFSPIMLPTRPNKVAETLNWSIFRNEEVINIFFEIYITSVGNNLMDIALLSLKIINCLLRIKIQFFRTEQGQLGYIEFIIRGLSNILKNGTGLKDEAILLEFTWVIRKTNRNINLSLYLTTQEYFEWLELVYHFTISVISSIPNKIYTLQNLVAFWAFFVPYAASLEIEQIGALKEHINKITYAYIDSKIQIPRLSNDNEESQFAGSHTDGVHINNEYMLQHIKHLGQLASLNQKEVCNVLANKFKNLLEALKAAHDPHATLQLVWTIYIFIEMVCDSKAPSKQNPETAMHAENHNNHESEEEAQLKGDITSEVFKFFIFIGQIKNEGNQVELVVLEEACLHFIDKFVKAYFSEKKNLGDDTIFIRIAANLGLADKTEVISFIMQQVLAVFKSQNLILARKMVGVLERLISNLNFFIDRANGRTLLKIGKLIISDEIFGPLFNQHMQDCYANIAGLGKDRFRVYKVLSKILHMSLDIRSDPDAIPNFLVPFGVRIAAINEQLAKLNEGAGAGVDMLAFEIMNVLYDLTGTLCCLESERKYVSMIESLFYINFFDSLIHIIQIFVNFPRVVIAVVKFVDEMVNPRGARIAPQPHSDLGARIFKFVSKVTAVVGAYITTNDAELSKMPTNEAYLRKYKPIFFISKIATNLVSSKLVNFSWLSLYKDRDCKEFYDFLFLLILITPIEEVSSYIKRAKWIYMFLEILSKNYVMFFAKYPVEHFAKILDLIHDGIQSFDLSVTINSMDTMANFCGHLLNVNKEKEKEEWVKILRQYLVLTSEKLQAMLKTSFIMILNGEISKYSYFSKMILALIIIENTYYINLISELNTFYGVEKSPYLAECFAELTQKIGPNYSTKCRDGFKKGLESFAEKVLSLK